MLQVGVGLPCDAVGITGVAVHFAGGFQHIPQQHLQLVDEAVDALGEIPQLVDGAGGDITVPVILQLFILELAVDGLKLAAVNTPGMLSTPLSILAGIVVGEYAVQSGWFNSESLLYMAVVTVGTYSQASFEMGYALKFIRIVNLILVQFFGRIGLLAGVIFAIVLVCFNRTISGKSYIYPVIPFNSQMFKRKILRVRLPHKIKNN